MMSARFNRRKSKSSLTNENEGQAGSSAGETSRQTHTPQKVFECLESYNVCRGDQADEALDKYPEFKSLVHEIVEPERASAKKMSDQEKIQQQQLWRLEVATNANYEDTFLLLCLPFIIKPVYTPTASTAEQAAQEGFEHAHQIKGFKLDGGYLANLEEQRCFRLDGLMPTMNILFTYKLVPNSARPNMLKLVPAASKSPNGWEISIGKPDRCLGYNYHLLDATIPTNFEVPKHIKALFDVAPLMQHPFLVGEGKSAGGDTTKKDNQAANDSAVVIECARELHKLAGLSGPGSNEVCPRADEETFVFSFTLSAETFIINVHWVEVDANGEDGKHFMNEVMGVRLRDDDSRVKASRWLHNIIEWGLWQRKTGVAAMRKALFQKLMTAGTNAQSDGSLASLSEAHEDVAMGE